MLLQLNDFPFDGHRRRQADRELLLKLKREAFQAQQQREKARPPKHDKLRSPYGQRK